MSPAPKVSCSDPPFRASSRTSIVISDPNPRDATRSQPFSGFPSPQPCSSTHKLNQLNRMILRILLRVSEMAGLIQVAPALGLIHEPPGSFTQIREESHESGRSTRHLP